MSSIRKLARDRDGVAVKDYPLRRQPVQAVQDNSCCRLPRAPFQLLKSLLRLDNSQG
jgi:hypothetical protein